MNVLATCSFPSETRRREISKGHPVSFDSRGVIVDSLGLTDRSQPGVDFAGIPLTTVDPRQQRQAAALNRAISGSTEFRFSRAGRQRWVHQSRLSQVYDPSLLRPTLDHLEFTANGFRLLGLLLN